MIKKQKAALKSLRDNRNEANQNQDELRRILKTKLKALGAGDDEVEKIGNFMEKMNEAGTQRPYRQVPKDRFLNLIEYMENNDNKGLYTPILQKILRKEIQNVDDLKQFVRNNNSDGKYNELLNQIKNQNLEMKNLLRWLEVHNPDGNYNFLIQEMKKNPDYNKLDVNNFVEKNNQDGKYDDLKRKLNFAS